MLFDLRGKRRRTVQATYLTLAILMGGGLVLFGIGSSVSGGLGDLFTGGGGGENEATETIQKQIDAAERTLQRTPQNEAALAELVRGHYQLATTTANPETSEFTSEGRGELLEATQAWQRYLDATEKPDQSLARIAIQAYDGLGRLTSDPQDSKPYWQGAAEAAELIATARETAQNYVLLVQYATLAGQTRKADLAGKRAVDLAPKEQRRAVKDQVKQITNPALAGQTQGGGGQP